MRRVIVPPLLLGEARCRSRGEKTALFIGKQGESRRIKQREKAWFGAAVTTHEYFALLIFVGENLQRTRWVRWASNACYIPQNMVRKRLYVK
jgi:hypothetical protein